MKRACAFCGHSAGAHTHYRAGTECSVALCGCRRYLGLFGSAEYWIRQRLSR